MPHGEKRKSRLYSLNRKAVIGYGKTLEQGEEAHGLTFLWSFTDGIM